MRRLQLERALGDVVHDRIACNVVQRLVLGRIFSPGPDDDRDLDLVIEFGGIARLPDVVVRAADAGCRLHEHHRLGWNLQAGFVRMIDIVQPDRDEFRDACIRDAETRVPAHQRQRFRANLAQLRQSLGRNRVLVDVVEDPGQIAQLALRVDDARLFESVPAITTKLHFLLPFHIIMPPPARFAALKGSEDCITGEVG